MGSIFGIYADVLESDKTKAYRRPSPNSRPVARALLEYENGKLVRVNRVESGDNHPRELTYDSETGQLVNIYNPASGKKIALIYDADGNLIDVVTTMVEREWGR